MQCLALMIPSLAAADGGAMAAIKCAQEGREAGSGKREAGSGGEVSLTRPAAGPAGAGPKAASNCAGKRVERKCLLPHSQGWMMRTSRGSTRP